MMSAIRTVFTVQIPAWAIEAIEISIAIGDMVDGIIPRLSDPAQLAPGSDHENREKRNMAKSTAHSSLLK
jgi:hypothetical protein